MRYARFYINGIRKEIVCSEDKRLIDVIRNDLGLTGTKRGCNEDYCGACSVIMDGKVVRSCLIPMISVADDAKIVTIEGIGTVAIRTLFKRPLLTRMLSSVVSVPLE